MRHGKTLLSKRIKERIEKCRFKLYKFLYNNWKPTRKFCMNRETADNLALDIHLNILRYKDNNTFEFNHNALDIIRYIFTVVILRQHFKIPTKTIKINNVKVIQNNPSVILESIVQDLDKSELVKNYTYRHTCEKLNNKISVISDILYYGLNQSRTFYSIDTTSNETELINIPPHIEEEEKFLGHKRFNEKYDGYYIVQVKRNDDFDVLSVDKHNRTLQYEVITSYTKIRASVIMDNNLYVVFSPFQKKAYMYHVNKRGFRFIRRIYNPNYVYQ